MRVVVVVGGNNSGGGGDDACVDRSVDRWADIYGCMDVHVCIYVCYALCMYVKAGGSIGR